MDRAMNISVLALESVFDSGLAVVLDAFTTANDLAALRSVPAPQFSVSLVGMRSPVYSAQRLSVPVRLASECPKPDLVIVPALGYKMPPQLLQALDREDVADAIIDLRRWAED